LEYSVVQGPEEAPVGVTAMTQVTSRNKTITRLPKLIVPDSVLHLLVRVPPDSKSWFDQAGLGIARVRITILSSEEESHYIEWAFRIRHA
jgi:hypothetical protein